MKLLTYIIVSLLCVESITAQLVVDTIPFTYNNGLLVFTGKINGSIAHFAFDTGASISVSNSNTNSNNNISTKKTERKVVDANSRVAKISNVFINEINIGTFTAKNIKAVSFDMPFLYCNHLFLLGQDVIKQVNWKFNFLQNELYISKQLFEVADSCSIWKIKNINRPLVPFTIHNKTYNNLLVDMGFTGILDVNTSTVTISDSVHAKNIVDSAISISMGLLGWGKPDIETQVQLPNFSILGTYFSDMQAEVANNTSNKIGMQFFRNYTHYLVLNNSANSYHIAWRKLPLPMAKNKSVVSIIYEEGKFVVKGKVLSNAIAQKLDINEEIVAINEKKASDFSTECDFLQWYLAVKNKAYTITKKNGEVLTINN